MAPPIDEDRRCETPGKAEWYNLLREAADSSAAFIVARELTLLESVVDDPNATADLEPFRLAEENLEALLQMAPTPGYLSLLAEEGGLQSCPTQQETPPVWMAYSDGGTKRAPVELCHSCQFVGALPLGNLAIDPNNIKTTIDLMVFENLYAGLLVHSGFNSYEFGLADRYEVSPDGLTYRIHLREGLRWSDGAAITSNDLRFAIQRQLTRGNASRNAAELFPIENAEAYFGGEFPTLTKWG